MKPETKLALRRFAIRWLRYLLDWCDDRLHAAEVQLRADLEAHNSFPVRRPAGEEKRDAGEIGRISPRRESLLPVSGIAIGVDIVGGGAQPVVRRKPRRRGISASAFDLRFSTKG